MAPTGAWLELFVGPIRWIGIGMGFNSNFLYVPDPRITSYFPQVVVFPIREHTFLGFGRVKAVRWKAWWKADKHGELATSDRSFSLRIAEHLSQDRVLVEKIIPRTGRPADPPCMSAGDLKCVQTAPDHCCWIIFGIHWAGEWTKPIWDCYQAIAEALLAMPMPTDE